MVTLDVSVKKAPCQTTDPLTLPSAFAKLAGTGKAKPDRKTSSLPESGTVVIQVCVRVSNEVEAQIAVGEKVICAFGTAKLYA